MRLDGFDAEVQFFRDLTCAVTLADQAEDFEFAIAQVFDRRAGTSCAATDELVHHFLFHPFAEIDFAGKNLADGGEDFVGRFLFHDVTSSASAKGANGVERLVVHREDQDESARVAHFDVLEQLNACLLYTSDAADERSSVDLGGRR